MDSSSINAPNLLRSLIGSSDPFAILLDAVYCAFNNLAFCSNCFLSMFDVVGVCVCVCDVAAGELALGFGLRAVITFELSVILKSFS